MQINSDEKNGILTLKLMGDIDINSSPDFKKIFERKVAGKKYDKVLINFSNVNYVDSSGLATIVEIYKNLKSYGGKLRLSNLSGTVKGLFEITKLDKLFEIFDKEENAVKDF